MSISKTLATVLSATALLCLASCSKGCKQEESLPPTTPAPATTQAGDAGAATGGTPTTLTSNDATPLVGANVDLSPDASGLSKAVVVMKTSKGTLKFKLYSKDAPTTVKRFAELVQAKFYNGLSFHRVVPGFVVQAGDPKSRNKNDTGIGNGGSGQKLKAEFNGRKHVRGTVGMARTSSDPDSADSQFYLSLGNFPHLDGTYTVIGQVIDFGEKVSDKDVLDRIRKDDDLVDMHLE